METRTFSRDELYSLVWQRPIRTIAKEVGISDVGLSKICRKHDIPTPPVGYWTKRAHGKAVKQTSLPQAKEGDAPAMIEIREQPPSANAESLRTTTIVRDASIALAVAEVRKPENKIIVADALRSPHELIVSTRSALDGARPDTYGLLSPSRRHAGRSVQIIVSKGCIPRALRIADALVKGLERFGFKFRSVSEQWNKHLYVTLSGEEFAFRLREKVRRQPHVMTEAEKASKAKYGFSSGPSYDYLPTAIFELSLSGTGYWWPCVSSRDGKDKRVEDHLNDFIIKTLEQVDLAKIKRVEREREQEERKDRERRRNDLENKRQKEKARVEELLGEAKSWRKSRLIRDYVIAVKEDAERAESSGLSEKLVRWLAWASEQADRFDPLKPSPPSVLDPHPELDRGWYEC